MIRAGNYTVDEQTKKHDICLRQRSKPFTTLLNGTCPTCHWCQ